VPTDVSEKHIAYIFRVEKMSSPRNQQASRWLSFFNPEDGGDIFLRNLG
jgi:hypothetical protein